MVENYHVNVPGYAGYKPKYDIDTKKLRGSCFDFKQWFELFIIISFIKRFKIL